MYVLKIISSTHDAKLDIHQGKKKTGFLPHTLYENQFKINDLSLRPDTFKLQDKNLSKTFQNLVISNNFWKKTIIC